MSSVHPAGDHHLAQFEVAGISQEQNNLLPTTQGTFVAMNTVDSGMPNMSITNYLHPNEISKQSMDQNVTRNIGSSPVY